MVGRRIRGSWQGGGEGCMHGQDGEEGEDGYREEDKGELVGRRRRVHGQDGEEGEDGYREEEKGELVGRRRFLNNLLTSVKNSRPEGIRTYFLSFHEQTFQTFQPFQATELSTAAGSLSLLFSLSAHSEHHHLPHNTISELLLIAMQSSRSLFLGEIMSLDWIVWF